MIKKRVCQSCGQRYYTNRKNTRYCCLSCRTKARRQRRRNGSSGAVRKQLPS